MNPEAGELNEEQFRANRFELVSRLADDLAHEIKNPLNAIVINLEVLRARIRKGNGPAALDRVDVIETEVRRLHHLVDRMLQLLRPDRDETPLSLDRALDEIVPLVEAQTKLSRNEFSADCNASVFVAARRDVLKFALLNLFTAVHQRLGEGGGTLALLCDINDQHVRLYIRDVHSANAGEPGLDCVADAARIAGALLASSGGRVEQDESGVTIVIPRARSS